MKKRIALLLICLMGVLALAACKKPVPESLVITPPTTLTYVAGTEKLDLTGGKVGVKYNDGKINDEVSLDNSQVKLTYDLSLAGTVQVNVEYQKFEGAFNVNVIPKENVERIEIKTNPYKTTYGNFIKAEYVETRGGMLEVHFKGEAQSALVPLDDPAVSVWNVDRDTKTITVLYNGLLTSYTYTPDEQEIGYVKVTKMPERVTYRSNATEADVDFTGGEYEIEIKGSKGGKYEFNNRVKAKKIYINEGYVEFERDLNDVGGYIGENKKIAGFFDIKSVDVWVTDIKIIDKPTAAYAATTTKDKTSLSGGKAEITKSNGQKEEVSLTDPRFSVSDIVLDAMDEYNAQFTIRFQDDVVAPSQIVDTYDFPVVAGSHTTATFLSYAQRYLPAFESFNFRLKAKLTPRQEEIAQTALSMYVAEQDKASVKNLADTVIPYAFYADLANINENIWPEFDEALDALLASRTQKSAFLTSCQPIIQAFNEFETKYSDVNIGEMVFTKYGDITITIGDQRDSTLNDRDENLTPYFVAVGEAGTPGKSETLIGLLDSIAANWNPTEIRALHGTADPRATKIKDAYNLLAENNWANAQAISKVATGSDWREDAMDIIYAYYYDDSFRAAYIPGDRSTNLYIGEVYKTGTDGKLVVDYVLNPEVNNMLVNGALAPVIDEFTTLMQALMKNFSVSETTMFLYRHREYVAMLEALKSYPYETTLNIMNAHRAEAWFNPGQIPSLKAAPDLLIEKRPVAEMRLAVDAYDKEVIQELVGKDFLEKPEIIAFIDKYVPFVWDYVPNDSLMLERFDNPFPQGDATFDATFEEILEMFKGFTHAEQGIFLKFVDVASLADSESYFILMMDSYLKTRLNEEEFALQQQTMYTYTDLTFLCFDGLRTLTLSNYRGEVAMLKSLYKPMGTLSATFNEVCGDMFNFCLVSEESLSNIPFTMQETVEYFYNVNKYHRMYNYKFDTVWGFAFIVYLRDFEIKLKDWYVLDGKDDEFLKTIVLDGVSMYDSYMAFKQTYDDNYGQYDGIEGFKDLFKYGQKWIFERSSYIDAPQFKLDMQDILKEYNGHTRIVQFQYFYSSTTVFNGMIVDFYGTQQLKKAELQWVSTNFINQFAFLMIKFAEMNLETRENEPNPDQQAIDDAKALLRTTEDSFLEYMVDCIDEYEALDDIKSDGFREKFFKDEIKEMIGLDGLYEMWCEQYNLILAKRETEQG